MPELNRRDFLTTGALTTAAILSGCVTPPRDEGVIMTVTGPISPGDLGLTLMHEHVVVDFIGAAKTSPDRYDAELAFNTA